LLEGLLTRIRRSEQAWKWDETGGQSGAAEGWPMRPWTIAPPGTHWLLPAALLLVVASMAGRAGRIRPLDIGIAAAVGATALVTRYGFGVWGPLRVNALAPLWLDGAISDPGQLYGYGPGYPEIFSFVAQVLPSKPDSAIFAANGLISSAIGALTFALARALGLDEARAAGAALVVAVDPVGVRVATTESYGPAIGALTVAGSVLLTRAARFAARSERRPATLLAVAAGLILAQSVRIHPVAWIPAALAPLTALAAGGEGGLRQRLRYAATGGGIAAAIVAAASGAIVFHQWTLLRESEVMAPSGPAVAWWLPLLALSWAVAAYRWARPFWPALPAVLQVGAMMATRHDFAQSWIWQQSYDRLFLVLPVVALCSFVPRSWGRRDAVRIAFVAACGLCLLASRPLLTERTTDHLEYRWVRDSLAALPPECLVLYVGQVGKRNMRLPIFGAPARPARVAVPIDGNEPGDLADRLRGSPCTYYVRTSLCSSRDARSACDRIESLFDLERVTSAVFPAVPSNVAMPYDRAQVESTVYRVGSVRR
jgi:hypothetical protein